MTGVLLASRPDEFREPRSDYVREVTTTQSIFYNEALMRFFNSTKDYGRKDNMLTKYQMIKFVDFCEMWFLLESVARVDTVVGDHRCHTPRHLFKETLDVFLGYSRPSSFHTLPKLI
ncbi:uncharacterized protein TNCV_127541 [Trichonephila clavipes]|nr:uncharacterized protein TNCV_127541 [Trichonephila clavipes]